MQETERSSIRLLNKSRPPIFSPPSPSSPPPSFLPPSSLPPPFHLEPSPIPPSLIHPSSSLPPSSLPPLPLRPPSHPPASSSFPCVYHKEQVITNFCKARECLMPLCPQCVGIHTEDHSRQGTYGYFQPIAEVIGECWKDVKKLQEEYQKTRESVLQMKNNATSFKNRLLFSLKESKKRLLSLVDSYYSSLESSLTSSTYPSSSTELSLDVAVSKVDERLNELEKFLTKLRGNKFLKHLIVFQNSEVVNENNTYISEIRDFLQKYEQTVPRLVDCLTERDILPILEKSVYIFNPAFPRGSPNDLNLPHTYQNEGIPNHPRSAQKHENPSQNYPPPSSFAYPPPPSSYPLPPSSYPPPPSSYSSPPSSYPPPPPSSYPPPPSSYPFPPPPSSYPIPPSSYHPPSSLYHPPPPPSSYPSYDEEQGPFSGVKRKLDSGFKRMRSPGGQDNIFSSPNELNGRSFLD